MPATIKLTLQLESNSTQGIHLGASAGAAILTMIAAQNPNFAQELHDANPKPYSLGLEPDSGFGGVHGRYLELRLQVLHDALTPILQAALEPGAFFGTQADPLRGRLLNVEVETESYTEFVARVAALPVQRLIRLEFLSATAVSGGGNTWALPLPNYMFNGLRLRFEKFSNLRLQGSFSSYTNQQLECQHYRVYQKLERLSAKEQFDGFKGTATLVCQGQPESVRVMVLLARFAEWSGIGVNTAFGCGQVRVALETARVRDEAGEELRFTN